MRLIFIVAHYSACGFCLVGLSQTDNDMNWITKFGYSELENSSIYVHALYFAFITCTTVGYGDISPQTTTERLYGIIMALISVGVFAYGVNTIGGIISNIE